MDYINADPTADSSDRTNCSGVRVLDGEDQGKQLIIVMFGGD